jgi:hypothetical protein
MVERLKMEKSILEQGLKATTPAMRVPAVVLDGCASTVERKKKIKELCRGGHG